MSGMLKHLAQNAHGYPPDLTPEHWKEIIEEMGKGFEVVKLLDDCNDPKERDKLMRQYNRGMDLFKEYYFNLWD
jgi:predicted secreted protein